MTENDMTILQRGHVNNPKLMHDVESDYWCQVSLIVQRKLRRVSKNKMAVYNICTHVLPGRKVLRMLCMRAARDFSFGFDTVRNTYVVPVRG